MTRIRRQRKGRTRGSSGYMLLVLMLAVAVLTITMLGVARNYRRSIQRDREVEMVHRGVQYARAIGRFYHKYGRYPVSIEQLEDMNKIRFLRKRYKDPMFPEGEWKLVHATDLKLTGTTGQPGAGGAAGGTVPGGSPAGGASAGGTPDQSQAGTGDTTTGGSTASTPGTGTGGGTGTGSAFGNSAQGTSAFGNSGGSNSTGGANNAANGQTLGGGDIYGVVSKSKKEGIHSFGEKTKYSDWFFVYAPAQDKGQLITGPYNPKMFIGTAASGTAPAGTGGPGSQIGNQPGGMGTTSSPGAGSPGATTPAAPTTPAPSTPTP